MKNFLLKVLANIIFLIHCVVVASVLFGWLVPELWQYYLLLLFVVLTTDLALEYCPLSKWEFLIRKKLNPHLKYDYSFSSFYTYKITKKRLSEHFISQVGGFFMISAIVITGYLHIFL